MNPDLLIPQAIVVTGPAGPEVVARSADFPFAWEEAALKAAVRFGRRPPGVPCPAAVFAVPVGSTHAAVVQVADQGPGGRDVESGSVPAPALGFRFLVLTRRLYEALGDPFAVADRFPPDWSARGTLDTLEWPPEPLPKRTVEQVQTVLKSGDMPLLLGGAQALIDGGRLMIQATTPQADTLRGIWTLLPDRTRIDLWPATFAFANDLDFHAVVLPEPPTPWPPGYLTADQARDYPEGRYELALQIAAESGNQIELDRLFARRSSRDTLRLAMYLVLAAAIVAFALKFIR